MGVPLDMRELVPLVTYLFVMYVTPGPNNVLLTASGVNFGFRRTLPHMAGICSGVAIQLFLCALLFASTAQFIEEARRPLAVVGCGYLLWLSFRICRAAGPGRASISRPIGMVEAALFQNVNPKAWVMVANASLLFMPPSGGLRAALALMLSSVVVGLPSCAAWAWGGDRLRRRMRRPAMLRAFNLAMAGMLAATALWLLGDEILRV